MALVDSHPKLAIKKIIHEHDRTARTYKNNVDLQRSHLNYTYGIEGKNADECLKTVMRRCHAIMQGKEIQKNTNVMSEWIVTFPAELCHEEKYHTGKTDRKGKQIVGTYNKPNSFELCKEFFNEVYKFTCDRYGKDNMLGGYVHYDETTPHIHMDIVPEAISRKNGKQTVSSASLMTRSELRNYHKDLAKHMISVFGNEAKSWILNGRTKTGESTEQMKARQAADEILLAKKKVLETKEQKLTNYERELNTKDDELTGMFLQVISEVTGKKYSEEDEIDDVIQDIKNWESNMLTLKQNIDADRILLKEERDSQEEKLRSIKNRIARQLEVLGTVQKGTEYSTAIDISKYGEISKFLKGGEEDGF